MKGSWEKGEIMRNARRLLKYRREGALGHANRMAEKMKEKGDEKNHVFWERIAAQIELLDQEIPQD